MFSTVSFRTLILSILFVGIGGYSFPQAVPNGLFSMTITTLEQGEPFPATYVNGIRMWCTESDWAQLNPREGVYDFTKLDAWLDEAARHNLDVLYTFARVPTWASSRPDMYCYNDRVPRGQCAAPKDLNPDGSGSDQIWKNFVTALVAHSVNNPTAHIHHWEMWNEPDTNSNWSGTTAQLVRMTADAAQIIKRLAPSTTINSPAPGGEWGIVHGMSAAAAWLKQFFQAGGGQYLDVVDFHTYVWDPNGRPTAEEVVPFIRNVKAVVAAAHKAEMPIWGTEGSYGDRQNSDSGFADPDAQAAFTARYMLLQGSEGIARFFWFAWDASTAPTGDGTLWSARSVPGCSTPSGDGGYLCEPGVAYNHISNWMRGATFTNKCAQLAHSNLWSCSFERPNNYVAQALWDPSKSCHDGHCNTGGVQVASQYTQYRDLAGGVHQIQNHTVPVGSKPILLENHNLK